MISLTGVVDKKTDHMSDLFQSRVKEQAEAYLQQLRTIPREEALKVMEQLLSELDRLRDVHCSERDYYRGNSCSTDQQD